MRHKKTLLICPEVSCVVALQGEGEGKGRRVSLSSPQRIATQASPEGLANGIMNNMNLGNFRSIQVSKPVSLLHVFVRIGVSDVYFLGLGLGYSKQGSLRVSDFTIHHPFLKNALVIIIEMHVSKKKSACSTMTI